MMLVYMKNSGKILRLLPKEINPLIFYDDYDEEFKANLEWLDFEGDLNDLKYCYIVNGEIKKRTNLEIEEKKKYGKILTEEERLNILLMPSQEEIQKAQTTIEILSLLQEVNII